MVYVVPLVLPREFADAKEPPATDFLEHMRATPTSIPTRPLPPRPGGFHSELLQTSWVYIRRGGTMPPGEKTFLIKMGNKEDRVLVDRLKPHLDKEPIQPAVPGCRGQPRPKQDVAVDTPSPTYAEVIAGGGGPL
jgi:hypothetical protein